jgi:hypothetical protein
VSQDNHQILNFGDTLVQGVIAGSSCVEAESLKLSDLNRKGRSKSSFRLIRDLPFDLHCSEQCPQVLSTRKAQIERESVSRATARTESRSMCFASGRNSRRF